MKIIPGITVRLRLWPWLWLYLLPLLAGCTGCSTLGYLVQAGTGQLALLNRARPIPEVIKDPRTPPRTARLLAQIPAIKDFGEKQGLKPTKNYTEYVQLDRPAAVWVVSAAEKLRFRSKEWSFPIVGHVPYLGWFDRKRAEKFASELEAEGWDVDLRGAGAYSTLGWFRDPILSSMIYDDDAAFGGLVNVVLHESTHATFYIAGQSTFNESLASFVGDRLTEQYLKEKTGEKSPETVAYFESEKRGETYDRRMHETYLKLGGVYDSSRTDEQKLAEKATILASLKEELHARRPLTNATLIDHKEYNTGHEEFAKLFAACGSDWKRFWSAVNRIDDKSFSKTNQSDIAPVILSVLPKSGS